MCARPLAQPRMGRRRRECWALPAVRGRRASRSDTRAARQAFERMHNTLSHRPKPKFPVVRVGWSFVGVTDVLFLATMITACAKLNDGVVRMRREPVKAISPKLSARSISHSLSHCIMCTRHCTASTVRVFHMQRPGLPRVCHFGELACPTLLGRGAHVTYMRRLLLRQSFSRMLLIDATWRKSTVLAVGW